MLRQQLAHTDAGSNRTVALLVFSAVLVFIIAIAAGISGSQPAPISAVPTHQQSPTPVPNPTLDISQEPAGAGNGASPNVYTASNVADTFFGGLMQNAGQISSLVTLGLIIMMLVGMIAVIGTIFVVFTVQ